LRNFGDAVSFAVMISKAFFHKFTHFHVIIDNVYYRGAPALPDASSAARHYTFRYFYQADGSRNLR